VAAIGAQIKRLELSKRERFAISALGLICSAVGFDTVGAGQSAASVCAGAAPLSAVKLVEAAPLSWVLAWTMAASTTQRSSGT